MLVKAKPKFYKDFHVDVDKDGVKHVFTCWGSVNLDVETVEALLNGEPVEIEIINKYLFEEVIDG